MPALPPSPDLFQIKRQAKELMKRHAAGDASCCASLRAVRELRDKSDAEILAAPLKLHQAQYAQAIGYGFPSWAALRRHVGAASTKPRIRILREGGRVWLEGVGSLGFPDYASSVHGAQHCVLEALGGDVSYDHLASVSGLAFRFQLHNAWRPSASHPHCGYECSHSVDAIPRARTSFEGPEPDEATIAKGRRAVVESIERGVPVHYMREEDGVIVGYADEGATWLCYHVFHECGRELLEVTEWPWGLCVFGEPAPPKKDRLTLAMEALGQACDMAQTPAVGDYYCGYEAWRQLAESLRVLEGEDPVELAGPLHANAWGYECLVRFHRSARAYLTELAGEHEEAAAALLKAAEIYRRLADQVLTDGGCTFFNIAPYAWSFGDGAPWTQETRLTEDERLEAGLPLEREASGYIAEALTTLRAKPESAVQRATRRPVYP